MKRLMAGSAAIVSVCAILAAHDMKTSRPQEESSIEFVTLTPENDPAMVAVHAAGQTRVPAAQTPDVPSTGKERVLKLLSDFRAGKIIRAVPAFKDDAQEFWDLMLQTYGPGWTGPRTHAMAKELCWSGMAGACSFLTYNSLNEIDDLKTKSKILTGRALADNNRLIEKLENERSQFALLGCLQGMAGNCYEGQYRLSFGVDDGQLAQQYEYYCLNGNALYCSVRASQKEIEEQKHCDGLGAQKQPNCGKNLTSESLDFYALGCEGGDISACGAVAADPRETATKRQATEQIEKDCAKGNESTDWLSSPWSSCLALLEISRRAGDSENIVRIGSQSCDRGLTRSCYDSVTALARTDDRQAAFEMMKRYCASADIFNDSIGPACTAVESSETLTPEIWAAILKAPPDENSLGGSISNSIRNDQKEKNQALPSD